MKKSLIALAVAAGFAAPSAFAQSAAPASPHTFTANVGVVSDYVFRGISQTAGKPALQGGVDYSHSSGFYVGAWASTIKWVENFQDRNVPVEIDLYGGYKNTFGGGDWNYDVGYIAYNYPGSKTTKANFSHKANTQELYAAIGWKFLTLKYSYATSSHFIGWYGGVAGGDTTKGTRGSDYLELNAAYDLGDGWGITGHVGKQRVKNYVSLGRTDADYVDWKLGVTKDFGFGVLGLAYTGTNASGSCSAAAFAAANGTVSAYCWGEYDRDTNTNKSFRNNSKDQILVTFSKTF